MGGELAKSLQWLMFWIFVVGKRGCKTKKIDNIKQNINIPISQNKCDLFIQNSNTIIISLSL